ncbi:hypothetical protein MSPP1_001740 [Malassezia sp. CBS 17886]|nr:hypothetical protein MSPP1_001740 [Malassezia sp. CBS 17886]
MSFPAPFPSFGETEFFRLEWLAPGVLGVELSRPPVNAFHVPKWTEMERIFRFIRVADPSLMDLMTPSEDAARRGLELRGLIARFQEAISSIEQCERPVIGVAHSHAIGLAIDILSTVDIRYVAQDTKFSIREAAIGLAADIGTLQRFPKVVGNDSVARELALTARFFDAAEAREIGFVSRVFETREDALRGAVETASQIAGLSPVAVTATKMTLVYSRDHSVPEGLGYMQNLNASMLQSADIGTAVQAALSKTTPTFAKL